MTQELQSDEKYCRFCAEIVKLSAVLCKHCKSNLSDISAANTRAQPSDSQQPQSKNSIPNSTNPDYETLVAKAYENVKPITVEELEEELRATEKEKPDSIELAE